MARSSQPPLPSVVRPIGDDGRKAYTGNPVDHKGTASLKQIQPRKRELVERQNTDEDILNDMEVYTTESIGSMVSVTCTRTKHISITADVPFTKLFKTFKSWSDK